ncbi:hypothetical protein EON63_04775 [archaeon]|nr:MAG: hypothetical protein EON63_04775 [archaeon]
MTRGVFLEPPSLTSPEHAQQQPDLQPPTPTQRLNYHANSSVLPRSLDMNLRIGLFGAGVVGGGVVELIKRYHTNGRLTGQGVSMEIVKICVRSKNKSRDFHIDPSIVFTTDNNDILGDPSINCIVEVMGGITDAKDVVFAALKAGKHVITANKALIAAYISEIQGILKANPSVRQV